MRIFAMGVKDSSACEVMEVADLKTEASMHEEVDGCSQNSSEGKEEHQEPQPGCSRERSLSPRPGTSKSSRGRKRTSVEPPLEALDAQQGDCKMGVKFLAVS
jgi:hypothetical protein